MRDLAGNPSVRLDIATNVVVDMDAPEVTIEADTDRATGPFTATFAFTEDVTGFALDDIAVTNGTASDLRALSASRYSATITPPHDVRIGRSAHRHGDHRAY